VTLMLLLLLDAAAEEVFWAAADDVVPPAADVLPASPWTVTVWVWSTVTVGPVMFCETDITITSVRVTAALFALSVVLCPCVDGQLWHLCAHS
jgi:hypothetical protein